MSTSTVEMPTIADLDELTPLVIQDGVPVGESQSDAPSPLPTEAEALAKVESFDEQFKALDAEGRSQLNAIGIEAKDLTDPATSAPRYVKLGAMIHNFCVHRFNLSPGNYDRGNELKLVDTTLRIHGVPESYRADHLLAVFHLVKVERSSTPEPGMPVTYANDAVPADWFGGNISYRVLVLLRTCVKRVSEKKAIDCWWFIEGNGIDVFVRDAIAKLRRGELAYAQVKALVAFHHERLKAEAKAASEKSMSRQQLEDAELARLRKEKEAKFTKLGTLMNGMQDYARDELALERPAIAQMLADRDVIPKSYGNAVPNMTVLAATMTPGEAKELIQALGSLYVSRPDRMDVIRAVNSAAVEVVKSLALRKQQSSEAAALKIAV